MSGVANPADIAGLIVNQLRDAGVACLFGMPGGGSNLNLIEAAGHAGLPFVLTSTETAAALAALAQSEVTGRPGACLTTLGPGVASVVNGVAAALLERAPLVVFTDSHPEIFAHQRLDQRALLGSVTKWSTALVPDTAAETVARAIELATAPPPGPVHLDCRGDVASVTLSPAAGSRIDPIRDSHVANREAEGQLDLLLSRARRPLLLVGLGARRSADAAAIRALCEQRRVPAMVTYKAKGVIPDGHRWFAGVFTNAVTEQPLLDESDLLIGLGLDPVELIPRAWKRQQPIVFCGPWPVEDRHVPFLVQFVTGAATAAQHIEAKLQSSEWDRARVGHAAIKQRQSVSARSDGLAAQRVVQVAAERLAPMGRVTVDAGAHMFPATLLWPVENPNDMLISNGLSTMGFALPAAIGAALIDRRRPVIALTGDGGLLMCVGELQTVVREGLRVIIIVFSDSSLSLIEVKQQQRRYRRAGVGIGPIDWPSLAASFGLTAFRAANETELVRAIELAAGCSGPCLIEARIDPSGYGTMLRAVRG